MDRDWDYFPMKPEDVAVVLVIIAQSLNCSLNFRLDGIELTANPKSTTQELIQQYNEQRWGKK